MKILVKNFASILFFLLLSVLSTSGQPGIPKKQTDLTVFDLNKDVYLKDESKKVEVLIPVNEEHTEFLINISTIVSKGELSLEIFDPAGEKHGNYSVGSQNSIKLESKTDNLTNSETVTGQISKKIKYPVTGNWKISIIPKNVTANIHVRTKQSN